MLASLFLRSLYEVWRIYIRLEYQKRFARFRNDLGRQEYDAKEFKADWKGTDIKAMD